MTGCKIMWGIPLLIGLAILAGCTTGSAVKIASPLAGDIKAIEGFTMEDLQNADRIAMAQTPPDVIGDVCYKGLIAFINTRQPPSRGYMPISPGGAFSALEAARGQVDAAEALTSRSRIQPLEIACGPLLLDSQGQAATFLAALAALGGANHP